MADFDLGALINSMGEGVAANPIESLFKMMPTYDNVQMQLRFQAEYFINKYDLEDARQVFASIDGMMSKNKNMTLFAQKNFQSILAAYTQTELVRGVKVQTVNNTSSNEGGVD